MPNWLNDLITWSQNFFTKYETIFSSINNLLGILAVGITVAGFLLGWWKRLWKFLSRIITFFRAPKPIVEFPFKIIESRTKLMEELYPQLPGQNIPDYDITFMERPADIEASKKLNSRGKLIITGNSKCGKTRIALELASNLLSDGYTVLLLRPHAWLDVPLEIPQTLVRRQLLVFVDGLEQYLTPTATSSTSFKTRPFITRLRSAIDQIESFVGDPDKVWFLSTANLKMLQLTDMDSDISTWNSISTIKIDPLSKDETLEFIKRLSAQTNIEIDNMLANTLAEKNDGSFYTLISAFRQWQTSNTKIIRTTQISDFSGSLSELWERKYFQCITKSPKSKYVYAALDILALAELPTDKTLVRFLAIGLQKPIFIPFLEFVFGAAAGIHPHPSRFKNILGLIGLLLKLLITIPVWIIFTPWLRSNDKALSYLQGNEIPVKDGFLQPYEGQTDGRGKEWYSSKIAEELISRQQSNFLKAVSFLIAPYEDNISPEKKLAKINAAIRLNPSSAWLHHERSHILMTLDEPELAIAEIESAIEMDSSNTINYHCAYQIYIDAKKYDKALEIIKTYFETEKKPISTARMRAKIFQEKGDFVEALSEYEKITLDKESKFFDLINKASILRELERYEESLETLHKALQKAHKKEKSWVHHALGHHFDDVGNHDLALNHWSQSITMLPKESSHYLCRAETQLNLNNFESARADSSKALKLKPKSKYPKFIQAKILFMQGEYSQCRSLIEKYLLEKPRPISTQLLYVAVLYSIGENYKNEAQLAGKLLSKESELGIKNSLTNLSKLLERIQSKRPPSKVLKAVSDSIMQTTDV